jgi:uncharacterized protein (UPF0332 family)
LTTAKRKNKPLAKRSPAPIDPAKLLEEARNYLGPAAPGRPDAFRMRRAASSAYYALFHSLSKGAAACLLPHGSQDEQLHLARMFNHVEMKQTCEWIAGRTGEARINQHLRPVVKRLKGTPIAEVASAFCDLQEARHRADYDHLEPVSRPAASASVDDAEKCMAILAKAQRADCEAFYALLALRARIPNTG